MKLENSDIIDRAVVETLENRQMYSSVAFENGVLNITGLANSSNHVKVTAHGHRIVTVLNGEVSSRRLAGLQSIRIVGGDENDSIEVNNKLTIPVTILSRAGDDRINSGAGDDQIEGGAGNDTIYGGGGNDQINGNAGNDRIFGQRGDDIIDGGAGVNRMHGGHGEDIFNNVQTRDIVNGGLGRDGMTMDESGVNSGNDGGGTDTGNNNGGTDNSNGGNDSGGSNNGGSDNQTPKPKPQVLGMSLVDASTGKAVAGFTNITSGAVIDLYKLPKKLNISAIVDAGTEAVRFDFDGTKMYRVEGIFPYALGGDDNGTFKAMNFSLGQHTLTTHTVDKDTGEVFDSAGVTFTVINSKPVNNGGTGQNSNDGSNGGGTSGAGNETDNGSTNNPTDPNAAASAPEAHITAISTTIPAGTAFHGDVLTSKLGHGDWQESQYLWDFGDEGSRFNKLKGFNAAHVYDNPGTYTVMLTILNDAGKSDSVTINITVTNAQRKIIYVSEDGSDFNDGTSKETAVRTFDRAARMVTDNTEILFRNGDTFNVDAGMWIKGNNVVIGTYGAGDRAKLYWNGERNSTAFINTSETATNVTIEGLSFDSKFNTDTDDDGVPLAFSIQGTNVTMRNNEFRNLQYGVNLNGKPDGTLIQDNVAPLETGIRKYFTWVEGERVTIIGNKVANSTREHIVRVNLVSKINIMDNEFHNISRRENGDYWDYRKTAINVQSGEFAYVTDNVIDGPFHIGPLGQEDGLKYTWRRFKYVVADSNEVQDDLLWVKHGAEHVMIRNNIIRKDGETAINVDSYNKTYDRSTVDIAFFNNTVYNNSSKGRMAELWGSVEGGLRFVNNLYVAPNLVIGQQETAAIRIHTTNLSGFTIDGNILPIAKTVQSWVGDQAINTIGDGYTEKVLVTGAQWNATTGIGTDIFANYAIGTTSGVKLNGKYIGSDINDYTTVTTSTGGNNSGGSNNSGGGSNNGGGGNNNSGGNNNTDPTPNPTPSAMGMVSGIHVNNVTKDTYDTIVKTLRQAGAGTIRLWYGFSRYDTTYVNGIAKYAKRFHDDGFKVLMIVNPENGLKGTAAQTAKQFNHITSIPGLVDAVDFWEVGNEVDAQKYWKGTLQNYVTDYLAPASKILHGLGEKVVSAGVSWNPEDIKTLADAGMLKYVDYVGYHPYRSSVEELKRCVARVKEIVGDKPLMATEWNVRGHEKESDRTAWANEIKEFWPVIRDNFYAAYYFVTYVMNSQAGPAGILKADGSPNGVFYSSYMSFKNTPADDILKKAA